MTDFDPSGHLLYSLRNAPTQPWPFPHFFASDVFPRDFYDKLREEIAEKSDFATYKSRYHGRTFAKTADLDCLKFMNSREFLAEVAQLFAPYLKERFAGRKCLLYNDLRLVRDGKGYFIGPHTDAVWKVVSLLFYLPADGWHMEHGTSLYTPYNSDFRCPGGPHHDFGGFKRIAVMPYLPNTCFGFFKTDNSFHGVEPIEADFKRDVLLYNIYSKEDYDLHHTPAESP